MILSKNDQDYTIFCKMTIAGSYKGQEKMLKPSAAPISLQYTKNWRKYSLYDDQNAFPKQNDLVVISARMAAMDAAKIKDIKILFIRVR